MSKVKLIGLVLILEAWVSGCGVKGDPLPPERPPEISRGKPTHQRASEDFKFPEPPPILEDEDGENKKDNGEAE